MPIYIVHFPRLFFFQAFLNLLNRTPRSLTDVTISKKLIVTSTMNIGIEVIPFFVVLFHFHQFKYNAMSLVNCVPLADSWHCIKTGENGKGGQKRI